LPSAEARNPARFPKTIQTMTSEKGPPGSGKENSRRRQQFPTLRLFSCRSPMGKNPRLANLAGGSLSRGKSRKKEERGPLHPLRGFTFYMPNIRKAHRTTALKAWISGEKEEPSIGRLLKLHSYTGSTLLFVKKKGGDCKRPDSGQGSWKDFHHRR